MKKTAIAMTILERHSLLQGFWCDTHRLGRFKLVEAQRVDPDWTHWTRDESLLESVREQLGSQIAASNCAP
jgi:hypothetical protein